ncbi:MAG: hypothetical protein ACRDU5_11900 [Mycobacterium sp.]
MHRLAATAASALLVGLLLAPPAHAAPSYGSNGVFGVGTEPRDGWATAYIPPGRYRVDQSPSMYPYLSPPGFWLRCNNFPCAPNHPNHIIATGSAIRDVSTFMDILPTDTAVSLHHVTLTMVG